MGFSEWFGDDNHSSRITNIRTILAKENSCLRIHAPPIALACLKIMILVHSSGLSGLFSESCRQGRTTEKTVQLLPGIVLLFTRIDPWCLFTMLVQTQRPRPVPTSFLVVKNGSKIFGRTDGGMPGPESATAMRTPGGWFG